MADHVSEWLGAYHDGELQGARAHQVEQHLAECVTCQAELQELQQLSAMLREPAASPDFHLTERFVANLTLSLPRRPEQPPARSALKIGWWLIPVGLLGIWLFIDVTLSLSSLANLAASTGLIGGEMVGLQGNSLEMSWFSTAMRLFGDQVGAPGRALLSMVNDANLFITQLVGRWIPQLIVSVLYLGWLFSWWLRHQQHATQSSGSLSES